MQEADTIAKGIDNEKLLYIIIAVTAVVLLVVLLGVLMLCRRKPQSSPEHTKKRSVFLTIILIFCIYLYNFMFLQLPKEQCGRSQTTGSVDTP